MHKTTDNKSKRKSRARRNAMLRFVLLEPDGSWPASFTRSASVACCEVDDVRDVLGQASWSTLWISPGSQTSDALLRNLTVLCAAHHGRQSHIGGILMLEPPRPRALSILHSLFDKVIGEAPSFRLLPHDQLADVLSAPKDEAQDLLIGGGVDVTSGTLALVRGNLDRLSVPLTMFRPSGRARPDFRRLELEDYGQTIRFGDYEAAADAILYEADADYRKRTNARRRAAQKGFGPSLRRLRLQKGLTRDSFPGITAKTIARLERGEVRKPQGKTLQVIAETLNVEPDLIETF